MVTADSDLIERALQNLVYNAFRYVDEGGFVRVGIRHEAGREGTGIATVRVTNSGPGIEPADLPHLFERYRYARHGHGQPVQRARGGSGLGLAIVHRIMQLHGTAIRVASTPGHETCFEFDLPIAR
ncbi:MAG: ATP-binding protein [Burkholderiaceae bacterium]